MITRWLANQHDDEQPEFFRILLIKAISTSAFNKFNIDTFISATLGSGAENPHETHFR